MLIIPLSDFEAPCHEHLGSASRPQSFNDLGSLARCLDIVDPTISSLTYADHVATITSHFHIHIAQSVQGILLICQPWNTFGDLYAPSTTARVSSNGASWYMHEESSADESVRIRDSRHGGMGAPARLKNQAARHQVETESPTLFQASRICL